MRRVLFLFGELNDSDVEWLGTASRLTKIAAGEPLIRAGSKPDNIAILLDGEMSVVLPGPPAVDLARLYAGEIVGELTFLDPRPPLVTVSAVTNCLLLEVPHATVQARLARDSAFGVRFYRGLGVFLASRLRETTGRFGVQATGVKLSAEEVEVDELDDEAMERTALAARRFEFLRGKLGVR
ncbi:MAG: cyclic nucleotide-binding domain-containing protein [Gammaproteobacteria bacterium]|nr:cyclic nucleotide-binding domain-containing protein [Gammaproteobacteria bacterium]